VEVVIISRATFESGSEFELAIVDGLQMMNKFNVFWNLSLPEKNRIGRPHELDVLCTIGYDIIAVEAKKYRKLNGNTGDEFWLFTDSWNRVLERKSPVLQNEENIQLLGRTLCRRGFTEIRKVRPFNFVVVSNNCEVVSNSKNVYILEDFLELTDRCWQPCEDCKELNEILEDMYLEQITRNLRRKASLQARYKNHNDSLMD